MNSANLANLHLVHKALEYCGIDSSRWSGLNPQLLLIVVSTLVVTINAIRYLATEKRPRAPVVGYRAFIEPTFVLRGRFFQGAGQIVTDGYNKVEDMYRANKQHC